MLPALRPARVLLRRLPWAKPPRQTGPAAAAAATPPPPAEPATPATEPHSTSPTP